MYKYISTDGFLSSLDKSKPSLFFDVDHTIIYPINHKKLYSAKDKYKWEPNPNAKSKLQKAFSQGFTIYFVTNQLKYDSIVENRLREMLRYLEIEALVLISDQRNKYRKPSPGFVEDSSISGGIPTVDASLSFHCGDAAGRIGYTSQDFSDDDLWFARYAGVNFYTPEEVFDPSFDFLEKRPLQKIPKSPPIDKELIKTLKSYYETSDGIMLIGLPGTGKSSIRHWYVDNSSSLFNQRPIYVYNNDENLHFPLSYKSTVSPFYIFDNTNLTKIQRSRFSEDLNLKIIYIDLSSKDAIRGIKYRNLFQDGIYIPDVVIHTMNSRKEIPEKIDLHLKHRPVLFENFPAYLI